MKRKIIIGSRGSDLALWQANFVKDQLGLLGHNAEIQIIKTKGDLIQHLSFDKMEGKGFFTKEIEEALLQKQIDIAVHSHKDLETSWPEGLMIAAVSDREDPAELLLIRKEGVDQTKKWMLREGAVVGTSAARRKSQLKAFRPDVSIKDLRGNVPTRVNKLRDGLYDAILVANAGISRLNLDLSDLHVQRLDPTEFIPAPAQGVLAFQIRNSDKELQDIVSNLNFDLIHTCISAERKFLKEFGGGCQQPVGAYCYQEGKYFHFWATAGVADNPFPVRVYLSGTNPDTLAGEALLQVKKKSTENPSGSPEN